MKTKSMHNPVGQAYSDKQVITAISAVDHAGQKALQWFLEHVKEYARGYLIKKYPHLNELEWETVFSNTDIKLVNRFRKGLSLEPGTRLSSYYVAVADFAALDVIRTRNKFNERAREKQAEVVDPPQILSDMEALDRAKSIRNWLESVVKHKEQVTVLLLFTKGYSHKEIIEFTHYDSEGACRNALVKGKQKIAKYLIEHPKQAQYIRSLLTDK